MKQAGIEALRMLILDEVRVSDNEIQFDTVCGRKFRMYYEPDCCASCDIESIVGDINDLLGTPIVVAEEVTSSDRYPPGYIGPLAPNSNDEWDYESHTWTFYKIDTWRGGVTIRWFGSSNGYYSETATFEEIGVDK